MNSGYRDTCNKFNTTTPCFENCCYIQTDFALIPCAYRKCNATTLGELPGELIDCLLRYNAFFDGN